MKKIQLARQIAKRLEDNPLKTEENNVALFFQSQFERAFATGGQEQGRRWEGFGGEPKYRSFKERVTGRVDVLRWPGSDRIYKAMTGQSDRNNRFTINGPEATWGARLRYADDLVDGGRVGPFGEKTPPRPFTTLAPRNVAHLGGLLLKVVVGKKVTASEWRSRG